MTDTNFTIGTVVEMNDEFNPKLNGLRGAVVGHSVIHRRGRATPVVLVEIHADLWVEVPGFDGGKMTVSVVPVCPEWLRIVETEA